MHEASKAIVPVHGIGYLPNLMNLLHLSFPVPVLLPSTSGLWFNYLGHLLSSCPICGLRHKMGPMKIPSFLGCVSQLLGRKFLQGPGIPCSLLTAETSTAEAVLQQLGHPEAQ